MAYPFYSLRNIINECKKESLSQRSASFFSSSCMVTILNTKVAIGSGQARVFIAMCQQNFISKKKWWAKPGLELALGEWNW